MATQTTSTPPTLLLHTSKLDPFIPFNRLHSLIYSFALLALFYHHFTTLLTSPSLFSSFLLLLSDSIFAFMWAIYQACRWRPIHRREFPDRLCEVVEDKDLPALDVFICTADPLKEPPMNVVNTALSVLAFDYPEEKLSVYVSDDGGSDLTLFAFVEAAKFARHWLPFCRENGVQLRAPEAYFSSNEGGDSDKIKIMYEMMKEKVEKAMKNGHVDNDLVTSPKEFDLFRRWKGFSQRDHPSVIQVLLESTRDADIMGNSMPNLVYVSREKNTSTHHHFKAGALNALVRVSGVMTNAPIVLTLDCDMYSNDAQTPRRALCYFLDPTTSTKLAFVQFPQQFKGINKNDIYGGENKRVFRINPRGQDGLQGPVCLGTGAFFRRQSLDGTPSSTALSLNSNELAVDAELSSETKLKRAHEVSGCTYEIGTKWGNKIGYRYGSLVEDYYTSYCLHCEGWESVFCDPERAAFLGDVPKNFDDMLSQSKRWWIGLLQVAFSRFNPLIFGIRKASFLVCLCYAYYAFWGIWCIPIPIYSLLPQLALMYDVPLFPKVTSPWFYLYAYLFSAAYFHDLLEFISNEGTFQRWWSDQRIWMIRSIASSLFGSFEFILNQLGISGPGFVVTSKVTEDGQNKRYKKGIFEFGTASPLFVPLGTVAIVNLSSFMVGILKATRKEGGFSEMFVQLFLSSFALLNCWPVIEAMFMRRDEGKMPRIITNVSILLAGLFCFIGYVIFKG